MLGHFRKERLLVRQSGRATVTKLTVNKKEIDLNIPGDTPLLWVLRDELGLTGTKFGCGIAQCGACTVHIDGAAVRSCQAPIGDLEGAHVTTIEGADSEHIEAVKKAWADHQVAQCGYCQIGQMMQAASLLELNSEPSDDDIDAVMSGNLCRCGTYVRVRAAIHTAAATLSEN